MNSNKSELISNIRRIEHNLKKRIENIEKNEDLPQFGAISFRKFESRLKNKLGDNKLSSLTEEELRTIYRDISYINNLKSSSVQGANLAKNIYLPIKEKLTTLSPNKKAEFWEAYNKIIDRFADFSRFKYELMDVNIDLIFDSMNSDDIVKNVFDLYDKFLEDREGRITDEETKVFFSDELRKLLE